VKSREVGAHKTSTNREVSLTEKKKRRKSCRGQNQFQGERGQIDSNCVFLKKRDPLMARDERTGASLGSRKTCLLRGQKNQEARRKNTRANKGSPRKSVGEKFRFAGCGHNFGCQWHRWKNGVLEKRRLEKRQRPIEGTVGRRGARKSPIRRQSLRLRVWETG